jgi:hypothetical protein
MRAFRVDRTFRKPKVSSGGTFDAIEVVPTEGIDISFGDEAHSDVYFASHKHEDCRLLIWDVPDDLYKVIEARTDNSNKNKGKPTEGKYAKDAKWERIVSWGSVRNSTDHWVTEKNLFAPHLPHGWVEELNKRCKGTKVQIVTREERFPELFVVAPVIAATTKGRITKDGILFDDDFTYEEFQTDWEESGATFQPN